MKQLAALIVLFVVSCAPRGVVSIAPIVETASLHRILVATERPILSVDGQSMGDVRDPTLRFAEAVVSIPPIHQIGEIEWPKRQTPDAAKHFVVTEGRLIHSTQNFIEALQSNGPSDDEMLLFVHGYNVNNAEAVYRVAQLAHDYRVTMPVALYSWPSAGQATGYVYDRDSVIFSRDGLERVLTELALRSNKKILLVAHSMGSQLVMETLRQISIGGKQQVLRRISGVMLLSPDIDEDVFARQLRRIDPVPQPFLIVAGENDRALNFLAFLTGRKERLGSIRNPEALKNLPIILLDVTALSDGQGLNHSLPFSNPKVIELLSGFSQTDFRTETGLAQVIRLGN